MRRPLTIALLLTTGAVEAAGKPLDPGTRRKGSAVTIGLAVPEPPPLHVYPNPLGAAALAPAAAVVPYAGVQGEEQRFVRDNGILDPAGTIGGGVVSELAKKYAAVVRPVA